LIITSGAFSVLRYLLLCFPTNPGCWILSSLLFCLCSDANLVRDEYLRSNMDEQGWVPISLIASFPRVS